MRTQLSALAAVFHLVLPLAGCGSSIDDGSAPAGEADIEPSPEASEVGEVSQALGAFTYTFASPEVFDSLHVGSVYAVFAERGCIDQLLLIYRTNGSQWPAVFDTCRRPVNAVSDSHVFIGDAEHNDIMRYGADEGFFGWKKIADTTGDPRGRMLLNSSHVFWSDDAGIRRAPRGGGAPSTILPTAERPVLEALDGSTIYYSVRNAQGRQNLRKMPVGGGGSVNLYTAPKDLGQVSVDLTHVYFVEQENPWIALHPAVNSRIRRQSKSSLDVETVWDHGDGRFYQSPISYDGKLYWLEVRNFEANVGGDTFMRRMRIGDYNTVVTRDYGYQHFIFRMGVFPDGVYTGGFVVHGFQDTESYLRRGDL